MVNVTVVIVVIIQTEHFPHGWPYQTLISSDARIEAYHMDKSSLKEGLQTARGRAP